MARARIDLPLGPSQVADVVLTLDGDTDCSLAVARIGNMDDPAMWKDEPAVFITNGDRPDVQPWTGHARVGNQHQGPLAAVLDRALTRTFALRVTPTAPRPLRSDPPEWRSAAPRQGAGVSATS